MKTWLPLALCLCLALPSSVSALEVPHDAGENHDVHRNLVGLRVGHLSVFESHEDEGRQHRSFALVGVSYERTLVHHWLELEISVPVAWSLNGERTVTMPIDVHFKLPFHATHRWSPYVAVGPSFDVELKPARDVLLGVSFALGTYYWFSMTFGLDFEGDYNLVFDNGEPVHELLVAVGPVWRF